MSMPDDGGPAFPATNGLEGEHNYPRGVSGMKLRDWFAGQAMSGMLADPGCGNTPESTYLIARGAYSVADAMIARRAAKVE